jgi:hypothetical protein
MNSASWVPSIAIIHRRVRSLNGFIRLGWAGCLLLILSAQGPFVDPLAAARERWTTSGYTDYRIVVEYAQPYFVCFMDFEVRAEKVTYAHQDTCNFGFNTSANPNNRSLSWPTVRNLFAQIEREQSAPRCGPNGCACDGPIEVTVTYDPTLGHATDLVYRLRPELRWQYPEFWDALINNTLQDCPRSQYVGQRIRVLSITALPPITPTPHESPQATVTVTPDPNEQLAPSGPKSTVEGIGTAIPAQETTTPTP